MSNANIGTGIVFEAGNGAVPEVFTPVAELVTLKPPSRTRNEVDVSNHNEGREAKILGMLRSGQVTGTCNWLPTDPTQADTGDGMLADINSNKKRNWRVRLPLPLTTKWTMAARVQLFDPQEVGVDGPLQFQFAMTIDGDIAIS